MPRKHVVTFKPGKYMEAKVRDLDEEEAKRADTSQNDDPYTNRSEADRPRVAKPKDSVPDSPSGRWDTE